MFMKNHFSKKAGSFWVQQTGMQLYATFGLRHHRIAIGWAAKETKLKRLVDRIDGMARERAVPRQVFAALVESAHGLPGAIRRVGLHVEP